MSDSKPALTKSEEPPIEAGEVGELEDLPFHEARHRAETARSLANLLVIILGASLAVHYVLTALLAFGGKEEAIKNLNSIFNAWLPAISSLVSAAGHLLLHEGKVMRGTRPGFVVAQPDRAQGALPEVFLSCYEIVNPEELRWAVRLYRVEQTIASSQSKAERGQAKQALWSLRKKYPSACSGYGFVVEIEEELVAVPEAWNLPSGAEIDGFRVTFQESLETDYSERTHRPIIAGILKEAIKRHFKDGQSTALGPLWQDFDRFCQMPEPGENTEFHFCRRFGVIAKVIAGNRWVLQLPISTATLDGSTILDYYQRGEVATLSGMIEAKQANRVDRSNRPFSARVVRDASAPGQRNVTVLDLLDPSIIAGHASLSRHEQVALSGGTVRCKPYGRPSVEIPKSQVRLVLDSQITGLDHSETIIEPEERQWLAQHLRDFIHGFVVYGRRIEVAERPVDAAAFATILVAPPSVRVAKKGGGETILPAKPLMTEVEIRERGKSRMEHVRRNGFLQHRPINPLLAWPMHLGSDRAERMKQDLNLILRSEGIEFVFDVFQYRDVDHLRSHLNKGAFDSLLAVLPEGGRQPYWDDDTHERIKRRLDIPSQCIHHDHTLPESWVNLPETDFMRADPRLSKRIRQRYELCVWNLLVKHHWVPFAPVDAFHYNVQIGLDVGGRHNTHAMACLGYGLSNPARGASISTGGNPH